MRECDSIMTENTIMPTYITNIYTPKRQMNVSLVPDWM